MSFRPNAVGLKVLSRAAMIAVAVWFSLQLLYPRASSPGSFPFRKAPAQNLLIVGVTVINVYAPNPATAIRPGMTIVVRGERIADVRPSTQEELRDLKTQIGQAGGEDADSGGTVDGRGLFAIPGLIDTHVHLEWNNDEAAMMKILLANGVTALLEAGNPSEKIFRIRRQSLSRNFLGPRMEVCGSLITSPPAAWPHMTVVTTANQVKQAIRARAMAGAKFAKIYAQLPPDLSQIAIEGAHRRGMRVMGHLGRTNALEATTLGINIITHLSGIADAALPDPETARVQQALGFAQGWQTTNAAWGQVVPEKLSALIRRMVANRVALSPTLWFQKIFATWGEDTEEKQEAVKYSHAPAAIMKGWQHFTMDLGDPDIYKSAWPLQKQFVKAFYEAGGMLIAGTDTPNQFVAPGFGLHQEIETFVEAGIPPLEALKAATVNASRALGHEEDFGSIEIGSRADFLLIEGNPLEDLKNARRIRTVFKGGIPYTPARLLSGLAP
ncbi:MAG: amidohydrolase family protein [Acidobacteriia bacterium]|nr:amidohydrolase family protein [Terriglobia bacterium]